MHSFPSSEHSFKKILIKRKRKGFRKAYVPVDDKDTSDDARVTLSHHLGRYCHVIEQAKAHGWRVECKGWTVGFRLE